MRFFSPSQSKSKGGSFHRKLLKSPKSLLSEAEKSAIKSSIPTAIGYESDDTDEDDIRQSRSRYDIEQRDDNALRDDKYGNKDLTHLSLENSFSGDLLWRPVVEPIGNEDPFAIDPEDDDWCSGGDSSYVDERESPLAELSLPPEPQTSLAKSTKYKSMLVMSKKDAQQMNSLGDQCETDQEIDDSGSCSTGSGSTASGSGKVARSTGAVAAAKAAVSTTVGAAGVANKTVTTKPSPAKVTSKATTTSKASRSKFFGWKDGSKKKPDNPAAPAETKTETTADDTKSKSASSKTVPTKTADEAKEKKVATSVATKNPPVSSATTTTIANDETNNATGGIKLNRRPSLKERLTSALTKKPSFKDSAAKAAANVVAQEKAIAIPAVVTATKERPHPIHTSMDASFDALLDSDTNTNNTERNHPTPASPSPTRQGATAVHDLFEDFLKSMSFGGNNKAAADDLDKSTDGSTARDNESIVAPESNKCTACLKSSVVYNPMASCFDNGGLTHLKCDEGLLVDPFTGEEQKPKGSVMSKRIVSSRSLALDDDDDDDADAIAAKERATKARDVIPIKSIEFHPPSGSVVGVTSASTSDKTKGRKRANTKKLAIDTTLSGEGQLKYSPSKLFGRFRRRASQNA